MSLQKYAEKKSFSSWVAGRETSKSSATQTLRQLGSNDEWKRLHLGDAATVEDAIQAAQQAFSGWAGMTAPERGRLLRALATILLDNQDLFAEVMAKEMGKPFMQGKGEVTYSAGFFNWFAGEAERIYGQIVPSQRPEQRILLLHQPVGVCGLITPWNFPLAMPARKIAAALAAGCTVVVKPSLQTPLSSLLLAQACEQAGIPIGAVNIVFGKGQEIGSALTTSSVVRKLSFTGSVSLGKELYAQCAKTLKKLTLELGGHAPTVVYDDADVEKAVQGTVDGKFRNNGQTCVCPNRIYVQQGIYKTFCKRFIEAVRDLKVGDALDPETDVSNVLMPSSKEKTIDHVQDAVAKGAQLHSSGEEYYHPKVLLNVTKQMKLYHEETFGPVAGVIPFTEDSEAIQQANDSDYGLAAYVFTQSLSRAQKTAEALEYGIVGVNDGVPSNPHASFGGIKESGFGREGGPRGIQEYLVEKYVSLVS